MKKKITLTVDKSEITAFEGQNIVKALKAHNIYIPTLCYFENMGDCLGTCRVCSIKINSRVVSGCTITALDGMEIEVDTPELNDMRKGLVELLFVEGNHYCPSCEKSGDCDLQALGYRMEMTAPRFHYRFDNREVDYRADHLLFEHNRCILCKRCTHKFVDDLDHRVFSFKGKGSHLEVEMDLDRANQLSEQRIDEVVNLCPVGAILKKGKGFDRPYGDRKYDKSPISL